MQGLFRGALPAMDAALRRAGVTTATAGTPTGISAVERLLGGDTTAAQGDSATQGDTTTADTAAADTGALMNEPGPLSSLLFAGQLPGEYLVPEERVPLADSLLRLPEVERLMPRGYEWHWGAEPISSAATSFRPFYVVSARAIVTGEALTDARAQFDNTFNQAIVQFELTRSAGRRFSRETAQNIGNNMAIILDGRVVSQPPVIRSQIGSNGQIELGSATIQEAQDLALVLRAGALPAPLSIVEERTVGPTLGRDSIEKARTAGAVAVGLVVIVMLAYYRAAGVLAIGALTVYGLLVMGGLAAFGATLTVPGLAGLVLSIGIAVDANILIFERVREELSFNKSVRTAVDEGFQHAMSAIVDSNVTTVITALFLFQFGTGPVRGFAITLVTGVLASMFTAIFVTRTLFMIWMQRRPALTTLSI
jgi:preprotein translocase subunit SecD